MCPPELGESVLGDVEAAADFPDREIVSYHVKNRLHVADEEIVFRAAALAAAENHTFGTTQGQGLLGAHRYQVALDFGHEAEGEAQHLAVDAVVEHVALLGRVEHYAFFSGRGP